MKNKTTAINFDQEADMLYPTLNKVEELLKEYQIVPVFYEVLADYMTPIRMFQALRKEGTTTLIFLLGNSSIYSWPTWCRLRRHRGFVWNIFCALSLVAFALDLKNHTNNSLGHNSRIFFFFELK